MVKDFVKTSRKQRREKASSKTADRIVTSFKSESSVGEEQLHLQYWKLHCRRLQCSYNR